MVLIDFSSSCPLYPDDIDRCGVILRTKRAFSSISLICCLLLMFLIYLFRKYEEFSQRMILMLTISAFCDSITYIAGDIYKEGPRCDSQAFFMTYFDWSTLLWVCCITFNLWLLGVKQIRKSRYEVWYHVFSWGVPLIFSSVPFIGDHYGPAGVWCWIGDNSPGWRLGVWYVPLYILVVIMLVSNGYVVFKVFVKATEWDGAFDSERQREKSALKQEVKVLLAYPFIYLILTIPPLIFRVYSAMHRYELTHYGLILATVIVGPALGACNAVAFVVDKETFKRLTPTQLKTAWKSHSSSSSTQVIHNYEVSDTSSPPASTYQAMSDSAAKGETSP